MNRNNLDLEKQDLVNNLKPFIKRILPRGIRKMVQNNREKDSRARIYFNNRLVVVNNNGSIEGAFPLFYWDTEPNFGDVIGPYLVSKITNLPIVNALHNDTPCLMTVGSILNMVDREHMVVWGSGLIKKPSNKELYKISNYKPKVLSVRGLKTSEILEDFGINVINKDAYGDPALIMPLLYQPKSMSSAKISICPHFIHKPEFIREIQTNDIINIIDVQADMESVIDQIAASSVCISTSLHGIIISQAYNIPWIWLEITDNNLKGDDFKFLDFFSTIEQSMVSHVKTKLSDIGNIDFKKLAHKASLPNKLYNEELILDALKQHLKSIQTAEISYLPKR